MNEKKILKIVLIILLVSNVVLIFNKRVKPLFENYFLEKEFREKLIQEKSRYKDEIEEKSQSEKYVYDEYKSTSSLDEADRMKEYVGKYFYYVKEKQYDKAYELLYSKFKDNKFNTLEKFIQYVENIYPNNFYLEYGEVKRFGYYYYVSVVIYDINEITNEMKSNVKGTVFVIKENDILDFKLSFGI